jgi:transposase
MRDWAVFGAYAAAVAALAAIVSARTSGAGNYAGGAFVLGLMGVAAVHTAVAFRSSPGDPGSSSQTGRQDNRRAIEAARHRMKRRKAALDLVRSDPALARELRVGRPELPREYDDGGLVDVNHVPGHILAAHLGLAPDEAAAVIAARDKLGAFASAHELSAYAELTPSRVDELRELMVFC